MPESEQHSVGDEVFRAKRKRTNRLSRSRMLSIFDGHVGHARCSTRYLKSFPCKKQVRLSGLIMALLPSFAEGSASESSNDIFFNFVKIIFQTCFYFFCVMFIFFVLHRYVITTYLKTLQNFSKEVNVLGMTSVMLVMLLITQWFGISMELGCFLGGFLIALSSSSSKSPTNQVKNKSRTTNDAMNGEKTIHGRIKLIY